MENNLNDIKFQYLQFDNICFNLKITNVNTLKEYANNKYNNIIKDKIINLLEDNDINQVISDVKQIILTNYNIDNRNTLINNTSKAEIYKDSIKDELEKDEENSCFEDANFNNNDNNIEYMEFDYSVLNKNNFIDSINDYVYFIQSPLQKTLLFICFNSDLDFNNKLNNLYKILVIDNSVNIYEIVLVLSYIIRSRNLNIVNSCKILIDKIYSQINIIEEEDYKKYCNLIIKILEDMATECSKLDVNSIEYKENKDSNNVHKILKEFEYEFNFTIDTLYKCIQCRNIVFSNIDLLNYHKYTPKFRYSYKRYKNSFIKNTECTSYFLKDAESIFVNNKYKLKIDNNKNKYCKFDFNCSKTGTTLNCLKCNYKIGTYSPIGIQCSCGSWVVPAIQIVKSKVDKHTIKNK